MSNVPICGVFETKSEIISFLDQSTQNGNQQTFLYLQHLLLI